MRQRYHFVVAGYVVMPEHVHMLVSEPKTLLLSRAIQALKISVAIQRRERPPPQSLWRLFLWGKSLSSTVVSHYTHSALAL
jgi:REP element-mobilizing transposase RayT